MKLFKISQTENRDYDTYDSAIVAAVDEDAARLTTPENNCAWNELLFTCWCSTPDAVKVEYIGEAREGTEAGVILASYNAG